MQLKLFIALSVHLLAVL